MNTIESDPNVTISHQRPTKLKALAMLIGALVMSAGFLAICGALKNSEYYVGFLFLLGWQVFEHGKINRLPHAIFGCSLGILLCYLLQYMIGNAIPMGGPIFTLIVAVILYCQFLGWLGHIVNMNTFTCLLVLTIPYIQQHASFRDAAIALAVGIVYFTAIISIALHFAAKLGRASSQ